MITRKELKMRNNFIMLILILFLGTAVFISGCGKKESPKDEKPSAAVEKKEKEEPGVVTLSEEKQKGAGIEVQKIAQESISAPLAATAVIEPNADRVSKISPRTSGKIVKLIASLGDRVKAGQPLAYFDSPELGQIWAEYLKAKGRAGLARKNLQREETLFEKKVSPEKDVLKAKQELSEVEADLNLSKERFRLLGIDISQLEIQNGKNADHPLIPISSAIGGAVIEKTVSQGEVVGPDKTLFTVDDLSALWVVIDIYEKDISKVKAGMPVKVLVTAFPEKVFRGRLSYIGDVVDERTRTVKARVTVDNSSGLLKPGMFATVSIDTAKGEVEKVIAISEEAILLEGTTRYVFVQVSPDKFKKKDITTGRAFGKKLEVIEGLKEGDTIAVKGVFILKSELKKESLEAE